jgi:hypothetical protein
MWFLIQALIVGAVMIANIYWQITDNPYAAAVVGGVLAFVVTDLFAGKRQGRVER